MNMYSDNQRKMLCRNRHCVKFSCLWFIIADTSLYLSRCSECHLRPLRRHTYGTGGRFLMIQTLRLMYSYYLSSHSLMCVSTVTWFSQKSHHPPCRPTPSCCVRDVADAVSDRVICIGQTCFFVVFPSIVFGICFSHLFNFRFFW